MAKKSKKAARKKQKKSPVKARTPFLITLAAALVIGGYIFYNKYNQPSLPGGINIASANVEALRGGETRPTLTPALFTGKVAAAYNIARENRDLLDSIYCYCNCKETIGHKSLLSCFADKHATSCDICQDQAFYAASRFQKVGDIAQVRIAVDKKFWRPLR